MFRFDHSFTIDHNFVTFNRNYFTGIFVYKILNPCFQNTSRQFTSQHSLKISLIDFNIFGQIENFKDILIILKTDSSQQSSNGQLLFTVDVRIHDIVNISSKLNPRTFERDDTGRIKFGTISMYALTEEYAWRTVKLGYNNTFRTIDDESRLIRHIRNRTKEYVLNNCIKILMIGICTV